MTKLQTEPYQHAVLANQSNGQFQLTLTLDRQQIETKYQSLLQQAAKNAEIPGFRKGHAPISQVEKQIDQSKLYEQILNDLIPKVYIDAVKHYQLKPIVDPHIEILNSEPGQDWQIRATSAEKPQVQLGDYIKKITGLLKTQKIWTPGQIDSTTNEKNTDKDSTDLTDTKHQQITQITEWLLKNISVEPAEIIVEQHTNRQLSQLLDQIQKLGITLDQYLSSTHKTVEDLKTENYQKAKIELQLEFIIMAVAEQQKITVSDQEIEQLINTAPDEQTKTHLRSSAQKSQIYNIVYRQKTLEKLIFLAS